MPLRTLLVAAVTVGALAAPASAARESRFVGACGFDTVNQKDVDGDRFRGAIYVYGVLYDTDADDLPASASVTCYVAVDDVPQPGTRVTVPATGAVAAAVPVHYDARDDQQVELCLEVDFLSDDTPTYREGCGYGYGFPGEQIPPQEVINLVEDVLGAYDVVDDLVIEHVDPAVCPPLVAHAGAYGPVTVAPDGDVAVAEAAFWDCPPYHAP